jgi:hypothetical protein
VPSAAPLPWQRLTAKTIAFNDYRSDPLADRMTALIRFEDWERTRPLQKQLLSLYPAYVEPVINVSVNGITRPYKDKLHMYVAEARFVLDKPPGTLRPAHYVSMPLLEKLDPSIKHQALAAADIMPLKDPESAHNRHPQRAWCQASAGSLCVLSRYKLEGKLPMGIALANKLSEGEKKISDVIEFQSEIRAVDLGEGDRDAMTKLTGVASPMVGMLEQNIFYVNQVMQFGKFLAVFQQHPEDANRTLVTAYIALGVETDVLQKKKEYEQVPVFRNLVPAQVLAGNSSFNTGNSLSAGLHVYARNRMKAVAAMLQSE